MFNKKKCEFYKKICDIFGDACLIKNVLKWATHGGWHHESDRLIKTNN